LTIFLNIYIAQVVDNQKRVNMVKWATAHLKGGGENMLNGLGTRWLIHAVERGVAKNMQEGRRRVSIWILEIGSACYRQILASSREKKMGIWDGSPV
jgi:hypothetical protein